MGKSGQGFAKIFFWTVIFVFLLSSTCFASKQEVLQFKAIVPVTGPETNATVSLERGSKVILDASEDAIAAAYSWTYLGVPNEIKLLNKTTPSAYFWSEKPGVYKFELEITQDGAIIETKNVLVTIRDLHYVNINAPKIENEMDISTYSIAYPPEWVALNAVSDSKIGALTTTESIVDIKGNTSPHTVTLQCKNLATGVQYTSSTFLKGNNLEFSFSGVVLQKGDNIIEVTGIDDLGVICRDARFITYNPSIAFLEQLRLFPKYEGDNLVNVKFSLQAKPVGENTLPEKFDLYETTVSGDILQKIAELEPDSTASQGTYSTILTPNCSEDKFYYYRAIINRGYHLQKSTTQSFWGQTDGYMASEREKDRHAGEILGSVVRKVLREGLVNGEVTISVEDLDRRMGKIAETLNERGDTEYVLLNQQGKRVRVKFTSGVEMDYNLTIIYDEIDDTPSESPVSSSIVSSDKVVSLHPFELQSGVGNNDLYYRIKNLFYNDYRFSNSYRAILN